MTTRPLQPHESGCNRYWFVSPERYHAALLSLGDLVAGLHPFPDCIVGIKRSGLFPAVYLSHRFKLPMFTDSEVKSLPMDRFSRPLIADTTVWSGKSARRTQGRLARCGVADPRVAAMFVRDDPFPEIDGLHYVELTDRIMHFWYDEEAEDEE